jgi:hypothetical protein
MLNVMNREMKMKPQQYVTSHLLRWQLGEGRREEWGGERERERERERDGMLSIGI